MEINNILKTNNRGFVMLFAVTLSAIILAITLGIVNVALKEIKFGTSAKDTNEAFFAADTGVEYAFYKDFKTPACALAEGQTESDCGGPDTVTNLGNTNTGCAVVTITKLADGTTTIVSKGYNIGSSTGCNPANSDPSLVEREIKVTY